MQTPVRPILTTLTPYWGRPEMLKGFLRSIIAASLPGIRHFIYFVGETPPPWWSVEVGDAPVITFVRQEQPSLSIGHYHNLGALSTTSEWIMKMDVDTIPHTRFFRELLPVLNTARDKEWFNVGMFYVDQASTSFFLRDDKLPLDPATYSVISHNPSAHSASRIKTPQATNFVCRRKDYVGMGGCDDRFQGWGWEDYQQIHGLEKRFLGRSPLLPPINIQNVTEKCRDQISLPKAAELFHRNKWLALLHRHHARPQGEYRHHSEENRHVLLENILR